MHAFFIKVLSEFIPPSKSNEYPRHIDEYASTFEAEIMMIMRKLIDLESF